ncbi:hypothetical protein DUNSADRAFT_4403 [Dunaliella salina]|uniref:GED domain-containing protein n=1 Tax=Dunaliella salina TaxID=3046 RepID=A0ABQ7GS67_DUNSA|nr:hypothetical protein DUNSADRAFT_4403 [Dunaliella salina]|eukprot:KAF5837423.1 hypothetical protein DUNSADRAFT_4403 [Dunaliella salina]
MKQLHQGLRASRKTFAQEVLTRRPIFRDPSGGLLDYKEDWEPPLPAGATSSAMTETQVQEIVGRNRTSELPTEVPTSARVEIIAAFMNTWEGLAYSFLRDLATAFGHALLRLISVQPLLRDCPELCSEFRVCLWPLLEEKMEVADRGVQHIVQMLAGAPLTALDGYFSSCKSKALAYINQRLKPELWGSTADVMADAMAIHKVVRQSFIDSVVLVVQNTFVDTVAAELPEHVQNHLQNIAQQDEEDGHISWQESDAVLDLVEYAPEIEGKRTSLSAAKEGLQQINRLLREELY